MTHGAYALMRPEVIPGDGFTGWVCRKCFVEASTESLREAQADVREHNRRFSR